jgi:hypothetical protein
MTHGPEKSDLSTVATKLTNKIGQPEAESVERRERAEGNMEGQHMRRTQSRESVSQGLDRVREAAQQKKKERFTALLHYVTIDRLMDAFSNLKREAAPGVDGATWQSYKQDLEINLMRLHEQVHRGTYRHLGYRFCPRLADIGGTRFWRIDPRADYGKLNVVSQHRLKLQRIAPHWDDMLRLSGSLLLGRAPATGIMRTLQVGDNPTRLA